MFIQIFPYGPLETNAILIGCKATKQAAVIDPSQGSTTPILKTAEKEHLEIKKIILTHSHWDHIADVRELKEKTGALLFVHALDAPNVIKPGTDGLPTYFPIQGAQPDGYLEEGKSIDLGHLHIDIIHTPGQSPGGVCLYFKAQKVLISGDTLFRGSMGRLDLPTGQPSLMWDSLHKLKILPPDTRVIPGHGGETTIGKESWLNRAKETFS
ncbi:MAG TPA: MBL fold metallo-hydrolase [Chlamydiales bacterium]|jgi:glyoxylase-like metal-dependent hydrolase (beta-lactamase superfamily II)|nr:MBL fold metallo-hydrolase [Chlamydiales bacterium]